jgi:hypothetical protein
MKALRSSEESVAIYHSPRRTARNVNHQHPCKNLKHPNLKKLLLRIRTARFNIKQMRIHIAQSYV